MKSVFAKIMQHPLSVLYSALLLFFALFTSGTALSGRTWDAALVDLVMAVLLICSMLRKITCNSERKVTLPEHAGAWGLVIFANLLMLISEGGFLGDLLRSCTFVILFSGTVLYFSGKNVLSACLLPTFWCCIFIPYHEEFMLMASYPLRLSATMLSALMLKGCGLNVVCSGSSLHLVNLDIAITDACSGINQLDAFILIAYIAVRIMHRKFYCQLLHFAFIIPAIIIGNAFRIVLTVLLFQKLGETVLNNCWHVALGYVQIVMALLFFIAVGKLLKNKPETTEELQEKGQ